MFALGQHEYLKATRRGRLQSEEDRKSCLFVKECD